jgi:hypothetical protein
MMVVILTGSGSGSGIADTVAVGVLLLYHWVSSWASKLILAKTPDPTKKVKPYITLNTQRSQIEKRKNHENLIVN